MRRPLFSPSDGGLSPPRLLALFCVAILAAACGSESPSPFEPETGPPAAQTMATDTAKAEAMDSVANTADSLAADGVAQAQSESLGADAAPRKTDEDALTIEELLADELFMASVQGVTEPSVSEPLTSALEALADGKTGRAQSLIKTAADEADALLDDRSADGDSLVSWSVIERYFEEAELL